MAEVFLHCFLALFAVSTVLPILPVLEELTHEVPRSQRASYRLQGLLQGNLAAVGFLFLAPPLFAALSLELSHLRIAGGVILLAFATHDILFSRNERKHRQVEGDESVELPPPVAPLGVPILIGPATLSTVLVLAEEHGRPLVLIALALNGLLNGVFVLLGDRILARVGEGASKAVGKIMSLVLATLGAGMLSTGVAEVLSK